MKKGIRLAVILAGGLLWAGAALADETAASSGATPAVSQATAVATPTTKAKKTKKAKKAAKEVWVCPMGDYTGSKPGKCPNCGMDLVQKK